MLKEELDKPRSDGRLVSWSVGWVGLGWLVQKAIGAHEGTAAC